MQPDTMKSNGFLDKNSGFSFFSLFFTLLEPVFLVDTEGVILDANTAFCDQFCTSVTECRGKNYHRLLLPEIADQRLTMIKEAVRTRKTVFWDDEQDEKFLRYSVHPCQSPQGEITQLLIIAQDVTDILKSLKNERLFSTSVIEAIPGSFYVIDAGGKMTVWNRYVRDQIFGKAESEMRGIIGIECIHPDDRAMMAEKIERIMKHGEELIAETKVLLLGGPEWRSFLMTGNRMVIDGNPFLIGAGIDITARKAAEEEVALQLQHIRSLREIDLAVRGTTDVYLPLKLWHETLKNRLKI